ncbi:peptidylprolyl isomerase [Sphingomonas bacterium]|uniref:peptidylprolyl isomerase n=1 Tax=Sphingomonas bacterium TaxID=1895847 RepID=UPI001576F941|nr:peptidylprolyl isomerase [Sphingomonas bacterium]
MRGLILAALLLGAAAPVDRPLPGYVRVRLVTSIGAIVVALDARHAPGTTANFLTYVDDGRLDDTRFYRSARRQAAAQFGFIQGGIGTDATRSIDPVAMERTDHTGIHHVDGTISMAHGPSPNSATANFSILVGPAPNMDARGAAAGYAAFGHVVAGMDVVRRILAVPTGGGFDEMKGQLILAPIRIIRAERLDGTPHPSGRFKTWLVFKNR